MPKLATVPRHLRRSVEPTDAELVHWLITSGPDPRCVRCGKIIGMFREGGDTCADCALKLLAKRAGIALRESKG